MRRDEAQIAGGLHDDGTEIQLGVTVQGSPVNTPNTQLKFLKPVCISTSYHESRATETETAKLHWELLCNIYALNL